MDSTILDCFTKLVSENERDRLQGGTGLLRHMSRRRTDEDNDKELNYALKRLIRGLGSSRVSSRKSFYTVFTAYLRTNQDQRGMETLLKMLDTELRAVKSNSKSENADINMGKILFCGALIRSNKLAACTEEERRKVLEILFSAGQSRSYLSFVSASFLADFINRLDDDESAGAAVWPLIKELVGKPWENQTLDSYYILLIMKDKFPMTVNTDFLEEDLSSGELLGGEHLKELLKLLTDIPRIVCSRHPVFKLFCEKIVSSDKLVEFWSGIDERFAKPSRSMEYLSLELFKHILNNIKDKSDIPMLLAPNFLRHMLRRLGSCQKNRQDEVATMFKTLLSQLVSVMNDKDVTSKTHIAVMKKLILCPGDIMIEKITGTKVLQMLTGNMKAESVKKLSKFYQEIASNARSKEKKGDAKQSWTNAERIYALQLFTRLLGHPAVTDQHNWRLEQLKFLFNLGLCEDVSGELAPQFKDSFYRALDHKLPKLSDLRAVLRELVCHLNEKLFVNEDLKLRNPLTDSAIKAWKTMFAFVTEVEDNHKNRKEALLIFTTMDLHMALQLFDDPDMAVSAINEIHSCYERLTKRKRNTANSEDHEPEWIQVIVDLLLSLLSRNSHLLRSVVRCVFPHMCPFINASSINQILDVLNPKNETSPLIREDEASDDSSTDDDEDEDEEMDESSEDSEKERKSDYKNGIEENEGTDSEEEDTEVDDDDEDEDDDDDDDDDVDGDDETVTDRLRMAVRQALGNDASVETDDEDIDVDEIDEEQGKRLNESLAAAFRILRENRRGNSKKQDKSGQALTHFRVRVIDLLESYIESGPSMSLALDMLVPLFGLLEFCIKDVNQKPLENRVRTCLKKLSSVKKFRDVEGVEAESLTEVAKSLMEKGERSTAVCQEMGDKLAECASFLVRCLQTSGILSDSLVEIYRQYMTAFFKKRDCVLPASLFKSVLQLVWSGNWQLAPLLVDYAFDESIRSFRRGQALELLTVFYRNHRLVKNAENEISLRRKMEKKLYASSIKLFTEMSAAPTELNKDGTSVNGSNSSKPKEVNQKFVSLLMNLLHSIYPQHLPKAWDWQAIAGSIASYRSLHSLSKDAKNAYKKLASLIGAPVNVVTLSKQAPSSKKEDRKSNGSSAAVQPTCINGDASPSDDNKMEDDEEDDSYSKMEDSSKILSKKRLKARSKRKDKQLLKKESREIREKAMPPAFDNFNFSALKLELENDTQPEDDSNLKNGTASDKSTGSKQKRVSMESSNTLNSTKKKRKKSSSAES